MMRVKICGITCLEDALLAVEKGAWAVGFNFYPLSPRYVSLEKAKEMMQRLPKTLIKIGLFIGYKDTAIMQHLEYLSLDYAQVYHHQWRPIEVTQRMILAFQVEQEIKLPPTILQAYHAILLDAPRGQDGLYGGTGRKGNWSLAAKLAQAYRVILAGGLTPSNVSEAVKRVSPYAVDVASGVEEKEGVKDRERVEEFILKAFRD